ncbi:hypothetical protein PtB15_10B137 [Puccinia triticina]|nr:hypothetical protein PtB15_10B137 [Puccinia triticina]
MDTENYTILMDFSQLIETVTVQEDHQSSERPQFPTSNVNALRIVPRGTAISLSTQDAPYLLPRDSSQRTNGLADLTRKARLQLQAEFIMKVFNRRVRLPSGTH